MSREVSGTTLSPRMPPSLNRRLREAFDIEEHVPEKRRCEVERCRVAVMQSSIEEAETVREGWIPRESSRRGEDSTLTRLMMMMTFITQGGEGRGNTNKKSKATKSKGRGLEVFITKR